MHGEIFESLKQNFPILNKLDDKCAITFETNDKNELFLCTETLSCNLNQQNCLELSQLFALLATAFE